ncbi:MAG: hypothetical protein KTR16_05205 [Acidiferrobacterales bacterium]|nr:hypothetical protein [Acidiferrobacterales bacterium]
MFEIFKSRVFSTYLTHYVINWILSLVLAVMFFAAVNPTLAKEPITLDFYMPISSQRQEGFTHRVEHGFAEHGLHQLEIKFADHWHSYQQKLKSGALGIYLAAPHFASWAINKHGFIPVVRIAEPLSFVIAAKRSQPEIFELNDLLNRTVCSQRPLNFDYLISVHAFYSLYGSSKNKFVADVKSEMLAEQSECFGFAISNHVLRERQLQGNDDFIRLYQGQKYNNYVLIVHPTIESETVSRLKQFFIAADTQALFRPILQQFAIETKLISAKWEDYPPSYADMLNSYWH